ncbi:MAG: branched-chain amino acid ABC transporter permease [Chloroflexi bacterium]|nr:branched-chain amino acid ABC transporter permease [Chloroflexota bacterium]
MAGYYESILIIVGINILQALGLFTVKSLGQISVGHAGFMAIGAYTTSLLTVKGGWPLVPALVLGGVVAGLFGALVGFPALRLSKLYLATMTLGFLVMTQVFFMNFTYVGGVGGLSGMNGTRGWLVWTFVALAVVYFWLLQRSRLGLAFDSIRQDEQVARAMGISTTRLKIFAFAKGALLMGLAGGLLAHHLFFIDPHLFGFKASVVPMIWVIFGGVETFWGPIAGATLLSVLPEVVRPLRGWYMFIYAAALILMMIVRPQGLLTRRMSLPRWLPGRASGTSGRGSFDATEEGRKREDGGQEVEEAAASSIRRPPSSL